MSKSAIEMNPMGEAMKWVSRITTVGISFAAPMVIGMWLDGKLDLSPILTLVGVALGLGAGVMMFVQLIKDLEMDIIPKEFIPTDPMDINIVNSMTRCTIKGEFGLPSGKTLPKLPAGKVWWVDEGKVVMRNEKDIQD